MPTDLDLTIILDTPRWQDVLPDYEAMCQKTIHQTLEATGHDASNKAASIVLADDPLLKSYNHQYRGKDKATNVLSFPASIPAGIPVENQNLGDILISLSTLEKEASEQNKNFSDHFQHMLIHGTLHLLGYDHLTEREANVMEDLEISILQTFGVSNPYIL